MGDGLGAGGSAGEGSESGVPTAGGGGEGTGEGGGERAPLKRKVAVLVGRRVVVKWWISGLMGGLIGC